MRFVLLAIALLAAPLLAGCATNAPASTTTTTTTTAPTPTGASGCAPPANATTPAHGSGTVTILTYTAYGPTADDFADFTNKTGWQVKLVQAGDAGEALTKAIVTKDQPVADVLFGVDNALIYRAKANGVFAPYASPALSGVPDKLRSPFCLDGQQLATPLDFGYVEMNYDTAWFASHNVSLPADLKDLANKTYAPRTVVENPYTSTPGTAFLLATVDRFGTDGSYTYKDFWRDFVANGGKIATTWDEAYGKDFTQGYDTTGSLDRPIVVSYSTSPAYNPMNGYGNATTANLDVAKGAWPQIEAIGLLAHAPNPDGGRALIDHMLSKQFQESAAFKQVMYPVLSSAKAPDAYATDAPQPAAPAGIPSAQIEAGLNAWEQGWRDATGQ